MVADLNQTGEPPSFRQRAADDRDKVWILGNKDTTQQLVRTFQQALVVPLFSALVLSGSDINTALP